MTTKNQLLDLATAASHDEDGLLRYEPLALLLAQESNSWRIMAALNQVHRNGAREAAGRLGDKAARTLTNLDALDALAKDI